MARFHFLVKILMLFAVARQTSCAVNDGEFTAERVEAIRSRLTAMGAGMPSWANRVRVPVNGLPHEASTSTVPGPVPGGFFDKLGQLLGSPSAASTGPDSRPAFDLINLQQKTRGLLMDFGLWDPTDDAVDYQSLAEVIGNEMRQYVGTNAWRNASSVCLNNTLQFFEDASQDAFYTRQMLSSNGEPVTLDAIFTFNFRSFGNVEQCQTVKAWNPDAPFETQYCELGYRTQTGNFYRIGLCFPASCSKNDLKELFLPIPVIGQNIRFDCLVDYPWNAAAISTVCVLCLFLLLVAMGTAYHVLAKRNEERNGGMSESKESTMLPNDSNKAAEVTENGHIQMNDHMAAKDNLGFSDTQEVDAAIVTKTNRDPTTKKRKRGSDMLDTIMMGFSSLHNGSKILNTEQPAGSLAVLNGIRVISMSWIVLGHTLSFLFYAGYLDDTRQVVTMLTDSFLFTVVVSGSLSVDTFFFLSGLLLTYLTLKQLKRNKGKINWILFYVHRFIRITPTYMLTIAIFASLAIHFGQGPGKIPIFESGAYYCGEYWWTNLLYINNLYPFPGDIGQMCLGYSWYLPNDMQFFVISPFIIYLLYKNAKLGMGMIVTMSLASFGVTAYLAAYYGAPVGLLPAYNNNTVEVYGSGSVDVIYAKPYCRIPAYLVGMAFGYIFYQVKGRTIRMSKSLNVFMWILSTVLALAVVYGVYRGQNGTMPQYAAVLYTVFSKPVFVMAVGWVAFACTVGYGGPVNAFLSWNFWAPLSRITFSAYLIHPILMYSLFTSANSQYHFTYSAFACWFIAYLVLSYTAAFVLSICVEGPILGLEKALLGGRARGKKE